MRPLATGLLWIVILAGTPARAGTIVSTIVGVGPSVSVVAGAIVEIDTTQTVGPGDTPLGGIGMVCDFSFEDFDSGGVALMIPGPLMNPPNSITLALPTCAAGFCENYVAAGDLLGTVPVLNPGDSFTFTRMSIDTTGLAPGVYRFGASFNGIGDVILADAVTDVTDQYRDGLIPATIIVVPEPGTGALLALGLAGLGMRRRLG